MFWFAAGCGLMLVAAVTVPLPIPTSPIVIASLLAFAKASRRVAGWMDRRVHAMAGSPYAIVRRIAGLIKAAQPTRD